MFSKSLLLFAFLLCLAVIIEGKEKKPATNFPGVKENKKNFMDNIGGWFKFGKKTEEPNLAPTYPALPRPRQTRQRRNRKNSTPQQSDQEEAPEAPKGPEPLPGLQSYPEIVV